MHTDDHSFDWQGLRFTLFAFVLSALIGGVAYGSTSFIASKFFSQSASQNAALASAISLTPIASAEELSTTTPLRVINAMTIADAIPATGKFIAADLVAMELSLYQDGALVAEYPIVSKGRPGTPWETPAGYYSIETKEKNHFSSIGHVNMPYSMQFYGNYFIHGWPTEPDGTPVPASYSGGCIRLNTDDAAKVYAFADRGTGVFVYDHSSAPAEPTLTLGSIPPPDVSAGSYIVADIDTGDVYAERNADIPVPIASVTKLMTALVANETISLDKTMSVAEGVLAHPEVATDTVSKTFLVDDLFYPLLMESNNAVADRLARYNGTANFVSWMNDTARALDMQSTHFADATGVSPEDVSTPDDLYRLAAYLVNKKSFVFKITTTPRKTIYADDGTPFSFSNFNEFFASSTFVGGKVGKTTPAEDTMVSVFSVPIDGITRRVAIIVLHSDDYTVDTQALLNWFGSAAETPEGACTACALPDGYRKIDL